MEPKSLFTTKTIVLTALLAALTVVGSALRITLPIDIGGGNVMSATISMNAIKELGLAVGKEAYAVVKATSVMVGIDD